ncbi:MAG: sulfite exporter TauE/SafE family protein [Bacteroidetes bacterium]|nr:MAG: sulfite exporter TauE/SafE family protein [Bacteroidota bacterium]
MSVSVVVVLIVIGLVAGTLSGLIGIGGAIIIIPSLVFLLGMDQYSAQGTSLATMLLPIGLLAALNYYKAGELNIKYAMVIAVAFFVGGYLGSKVALQIPEAVLRKVFAGILVLIALKMFLGK